MFGIIGEREISPEYHDSRRISVQLHKREGAFKNLRLKISQYETSLEMTPVLGLTRDSFTLEYMSDIL